jgi:hypothetical protein
MVFLLHIDPIGSEDNGHLQFNLLIGNFIKKKVGSELFVCRRNKEVVIFFGMSFAS